MSQHCSVLWSGGCDSTLLLYTIATAIEQNKLDYQSVRALTITNPQIPAQHESAASRNKLKQIFKERKLAIDYTVIKFESSDEITSPLSFIQALIWSSLSAIYLRIDEDLALGYIRGDDIWHSKDALNGIFGWQQSLTERTGKLLFPLEWLTKADVIDRLRIARLLKHVWYCEQPLIGKPCGKLCTPCRKHQEAKQSLRKYGHNTEATIDIKDLRLRRYDLSGKPRMTAKAVDKFVAMSDPKKESAVDTTNQDKKHERNNGRGTWRDGVRRNKFMRKTNS